MDTTSKILKKYIKLKLKVLKDFGINENEVRDKLESCTPEYQIDSVCRSLIRHKLGGE